MALPLFDNTDRTVLKQAEWLLGRMISLNLPRAISSPGVQLPTGLPQDLNPRADMLKL